MLKRVDELELEEVMLWWLWWSSDVNFQSFQLTVACLPILKRRASLSEFVFFVLGKFHFALINFNLHTFFFQFRLVSAEDSPAQNAASLRRIRRIRILCRPKTRLRCSVTEACAILEHLEATEALADVRATATGEIAILTKEPQIAKWDLDLNHLKS